jgi:hypothetical protein
MKKFILMLITSIIFVSCYDPTTTSTEVKIAGPTDKVESKATFVDFFDPVELVKDDSYIFTIIMDRNTGVLYVQKETGSYKYGISPIYDSDGTIMTKEKWLAKRAKKE